MIREFVTTITKRGQVTIPAEVRRLLGAKPRDKFAFRIEHGAVRLIPVEYSLETVFGSVTPNKRPEDFAERARSAKEEKVEQTLRELRQA
ncbi:MAG: AbrB family transcriptional regulator [Chloroflexota bacterium]|nr:AbrB family transcriptional regulator [Chloroflexota bacterium]